MREITFKEHDGNKHGSTVLDLRVESNDRLAGTYMSTESAAHDKSDEHIAGEPEP